MVYGIAIAIGIVAGGRLANRNPVRAVAGLFIAQAIVLVLLSFTAASLLLVVPTLAALGFPSFANIPGLQIYVVHLAKQVRPAAVDVASALNIAAFNFAITVGVWIGGLMVVSPLGLGDNTVGWRIPLRWSLGSDALEPRPSTVAPHPMRVPPHSPPDHRFWRAGFSKIACATSAA
ncbi:membrane hypothetical protein [Rhizobium mesoamericanum STM3625]|uniref:Major facilitator superfamily (MFS) profile domain-containing protein n=1 Tax=Rhizobium mesoamericanum STM3625 TaxID=1211777 RepID=K0PRJ7_9HYPH|nr:membrane hypothetical protein [Rhizobium mesoamericanum STM3625]